MKTSLLIMLVLVGLLGCEGGSDSQRMMGAQACTGTACNSGASGGQVRMSTASTTASDNTDVLQSEIDALNASGGGTLYIPKGTYLICSTLTIKSAVKIIGDPPAPSIINGTVPGGAADLGWTLGDGTWLKSCSTGVTLFSGNTLPLGGADWITGFSLEDLGFKGFYTVLKVGAFKQNSIAYGQFRNLIVDGTGNDNSTVQTYLPFDVENAQQVDFDLIQSYKVTNCFRMANNGDHLSTGVSQIRKPLCYIDPSAAPVTASISSITTANPAVVTLSVAPSQPLRTGDLIQITGVTGTDAAKLNTIHAVRYVVSQTEIQLDSDTSGRSFTASSATLKVGRYGLNLAAYCDSDGYACNSVPGSILNSVYVDHPQIMWFLASQQASAFVNVAMVAACNHTNGGTCSVSGATILGSDTEGKVDYHYLLYGANQNSLQVMSITDFELYSSSGAMRFWGNAGSTGWLSTTNSANQNIIQSTSDLYANLESTPNFMFGRMRGYIGWYSPLGYWFDITNGRVEMGTGSATINSGSNGYGLVGPLSTKYTNFGSGCATITLNDSELGWIESACTGSAQTINLQSCNRTTYSGIEVGVIASGAAPNVTIQAGGGGTIRGGSVNLHTQYQKALFKCVDIGSNVWQRLY